MDNMGVGGKGVEKYFKKEDFLKERSPEFLKKAAWQREQIDMAKKIGRKDLSKLHDLEIQTEDLVEEGKVQKSKLKRIQLAIEELNKEKIREEELVEMMEEEEKNKEENK